MKSKVINLFGDQPKIEKQEVKYSELLEQFLQPFVKEFDDVEFYEDVIDFIISAWNFANMKLILPEEENDAVFKSVEEEELDIDLLERMIAYKINTFKEYTNFIIDYKVVKEKDVTRFRVKTQTEDEYLQAMLDTMSGDASDDNFEENYINRIAITLRPLQPFSDWLSTLYPGDEHDLTESTTYLVSTEIEDIDKWLRKKFDKLFMQELEAWHTDKKAWPQKRNYKMFKQWFQVSSSTLVYDLEKVPVLKSV